MQEDQPVLGADLEEKKEAGEILAVSREAADEYFAAEEEAAILAECRMQ